MLIYAATHLWNYLPLFFFTKRSRLVYVQPKLISSVKFEFAEIVEFKAQSAYTANTRNLCFLSTLIRIDSWLVSGPCCAFVRCRVWNFTFSQSAENETVRSRRVCTVKWGKLSNISNSAHWQVMENGLYGVADCREWNYRQMPLRIWVSWRIWFYIPNF